MGVLRVSPSPRLGTGHPHGLFMAPAVSLPRLQPPSHPQLQRGPKYPTKKVQTPRTAVVLHLKRSWRKGALQLASFFLQEGSQPNQSPKHWQGHTRTLTQEKTSRTGGSGGSSCPPTAPPNHAARLWGAHTERAALAPGHHKKKKKKGGKGDREGASAPLPRFPREPSGMALLRNSGTGCREQARN